MHGHSEDGFAGELPGDALFPIGRGWGLDHAYRIDRIAPGFMRRMCRARLKWRQGCWAALSSGALDGSDFLVRATGSAEWHDASTDGLIRGFAETSPRMSARQLVEAAFQTCPDGYIGVLAKLHGEAASDPAFYGRLHNVFTSDEPLDRLRAKGLQQVAGLNEPKIEVAFALQDAAFLTPLALSRFHSVRSALAVQSQAAVVRSINPHLSDDDISAAFAAGRDAFQPWFHRLLRQSKATHPLPTDGDPDFERIGADNAKGIGLLMKNCLDVERVLPRSLSGIWSLVYWKSENLVIGMRKMDLGWAVTEVHLPNNASATTADMRKVADRVRPLGIVCPVPQEPEPHLQVLGDAFGMWKTADCWNFLEDWN